MNIYVAGSYPDALIFKIHYIHHFNIGLFINIYDNSCLHDTMVKQLVLKKLRVGWKPSHGTNLEIFIYSLGVHEGALG